MRPSAAEALKAAIRRSIPIIVALVVIGVVAMNVLKNVQGARYSATARVFHSNTQLAPALAEIQPAFQDPQRLAENALQLAKSPEPYERAARQLGESADAVSGATKAAGRQDSDLIAFTAETGDSRRSVRYANAVAAAYVAWRSDLQAGAIRSAIRQLEKRLETSGPDTSGRERAALLQDLDRLRLLETLNSGDAQVIETAHNGRKVSPAPVRDTLLGASLGFVLALLLAGAREAFNTRVRSEADVEDALNKPVLASIQTLPKRSALVTIGPHESRWGDTYALLAANVMQIRGGEKPTVLAVTSAIAGEGKTTTASNLAVAMALRGQRVVLADFDLRKPSVARIFRIPFDSPGVVQLVDGAAELSAALWNVHLNGVRAAGAGFAELESGNGTPQGSADGSLHVVPSGGHERGARIARSPVIPRLLSELSRDADIVILDTPPALATVEMAELSTNVDAVLIVVRHGRVTRRSLLTLSRQTDSWRAETIGAVITDAPAEEDEYYYYKK